MIIQYSGLVLLVFRVLFADDSDVKLFELSVIHTARRLAHQIAGAGRLREGDDIPDIIRAAQ